MIVLAKNRPKVNDIEDIPIRMSSCYRMSVMLNKTYDLGRKIRQKRGHISKFFVILYIEKLKFCYIFKSMTPSMLNELAKI